MIVLDASAAVEVLIGGQTRARLRARIDTEEIHAPYLIDVETLEALRRAERSRDLSHDRAADARDDFGALALVRYPHQPLLYRAWELRHNLTAYDAVYVALAEALEAPLVTCDSRLARAPGIRAAVEVYALA